MYYEHSSVCIAECIDHHRLPTTSMSAKMQTTHSNMVFSFVCIHEYTHFLVNFASIFYACIIHAHRKVIGTLVAYTYFAYL